MYIQLQDMKKQINNFVLIGGNNKKMHKYFK